MTQYHHHQKVTCVLQGFDIKDARISIDKDGQPYICHNDERFDGSAADDLLGYKYSWEINKDFTVTSVTNLKSAEPETWIPKKGKEYFVAYNGYISKFNWCDDGYDLFYLGVGNVFKTEKEAETFRTEAIARGKALVESQPKPKRLTRKEIEKLVGGAFEIVEE